MKFTACKEHLPSHKTNTVWMFWLHIKAMLFVTENKDSCDSTAALRFSGYKWQETQRMWQLGGGERSPPPPTMVGATHYKVCDFGTLHLKLGINIQIYFFKNGLWYFAGIKNWQYKQRNVNLGQASSITLKAKSFFLTQGANSELARAAIRVRTYPKRYLNTGTPAQSPKGTLFQTPFAPAENSGIISI